MGHIILLGDSIFDNKAYVDDGPSVIEQLQAELPEGWKASLKAVDGSTAGEIVEQIKSIPKDASHLIISTGGNNALNHIGMLTSPVNSIAEALNRMADIAASFEKEYYSMLENVLKHGLPTAVCTIYYPRFPDPQGQKLCVTALSVFNNCIIRAAFLNGLPLIDLRFVCSEAADYANEIEPSVKGGYKIVQTILQVVLTGKIKKRRTEVFF